METHGFDERAANNLIAVSKQSPKRASEIFANYLFKTQKRVEVPSAYVALFQDAAMTQIEQEFFESDEKFEGRAAELALKAADAYVKSNGSFEKAMEAITGESVKNRKTDETPDDRMNQLREYDKTYSAVDDAAES